jgi:hypothetical protein
MPPSEVSISEAAISFLGKNLSAKVPPKIYENIATVP